MVLRLTLMTGASAGKIVMPQSFDGKEERWAIKPFSKNRCIKR